MSRKWRCGLCRKETTDYDHWSDKLDESRALNIELEQTGTAYTFTHAETCNDCRRHVTLAIMRALTERMAPPLPTTQDVVDEIRRMRQELKPPSDYS